MAAGAHRIAELHLDLSVQADHEHRAYATLLFAVRPAGSRRHLRAACVECSDLRLWVSDPGKVTGFPRY